MANNFSRARPLNVFSIKPMTTAPEWIARSVSRLRGSRAAEGAPTAAQAAKVEVERSTHERLQATLRRGNEALSPRALRRLLADLQEVVAPRVSEVEGGARAQAVAQWYAQGKIRPAIDRTMPMSQLPAAFAHMGARAVIGKLVLVN